MYLFIFILSSYIIGRIMYRQQVITPLLVFILINLVTPQQILDMIEL